MRPSYDSGLRTYSALNSACRAGHDCGIGSMIHFAERMAYRQAAGTDETKVPTTSQRRLSSGAKREYSESQQKGPQNEELKQRCPSDCT